MKIHHWEKQPLEFWGKNLWNVGGEKSERWEKNPSEFWEKIQNFREKKIRILGKKNLWNFGEKNHNFGKSLWNFGEKNLRNFGKNLWCFGEKNPHLGS